MIKICGKVIVFLTQAWCHRYFISSDDTKPKPINIGKDTELARVGNCCLVITNESNSVLLTFPSIHSKVALSFA